MTNRGYQGVPLMLPNEQEHRRQIAQAVNQQLQGKLNAVVQITLTPNQTTTTITDARLGANTYIGFCPLTANAATAITGLYVSQQVNGSATLTHSNSAAVDRTFNLLLIG